LNFAVDPKSTTTRSRPTALLMAALVGTLVIASTIGFYALGASRSPATSSPQGYPLSASVTVKVYNGSTLEQSVTQNHDMVMNNFMNFLASWFSYLATSSTYSTFKMTDVGGNAQTLIGRDSGSTASYCTWACEISSPPYAGGYVAVGTGSAAPTRTDFKLGAQYQALVPVAAAPTYDPSTGNIVFGASEIAGTAATICEVGFFENWVIFGGAPWDNFLMFHDSLVSSPSNCASQGIAVQPGNNISVQYTVQLASTAYNNNFGILLAAILSNPLGNALTVKLTPTSGAAVSVNVYDQAYNTCCGYYAQSTSAPRADLGSGATGADSTIEVGTGTSANCPDNTATGYTQSRSAVNLCNPVLTYTPVSSYTFSPYVAVTAVTTTPTQYTITEAGYFDSFGSATSVFLMMRNTIVSGSTTGTSISQDYSITTTYEITMS